MDKEQAKRFSDHSSDMDFLFEKTLEFAKKIPAGIPFVEVGTRAGGSALLFAVAIQESKIQRPLFTIDPYGNKPYLRGKEVLNMNYNDGYYLTAMKELANFCQETKQFHYHWRMRSLDFIKIYDSIPMWFEGKEIPKEIGFAYLDGDHEENTIQEEITWFSSKRTV